MVNGKKPATGDPCMQYGYYASITRRNDSPYLRRQLFPLAGTRNRPFRLAGYDKWIARPTHRSPVAALASSTGARWTTDRLRPNSISVFDLSERCPALAARAVTTGPVVPLNCRTGVVSIGKCSFTTPFIKQAFSRKSDDRIIDDD